MVSYRHLRNDLCVMLIKTNVWIKKVSQHHSLCSHFAPQRSGIYTLSAPFLQESPLINQYS